LNSLGDRLPTQSGDGGKKRRNNLTTKEKEYAMTRTYYYVETSVREREDGKAYDEELWVTTDGPEYVLTMWRGLTRWNVEDEDGAELTDEEHATAKKKGYTV
jgi:hypothetical protein